MHKHSRFWNRLAAKYAKSPIEDEGAYEKKIAQTQKHFTPQASVLELGCGTGSTAIIHAPFVRHIQTVDFSARMLEIAKERARQAGVSNISFTESGIDEFEAPKDSFDVVMAMSVLHLLPDRTTAIAKIYAMLKPGGVFISSTHCLGNKMKFLKIVAPVAGIFGLLPVLRVFTVQELASSITDAGFAIENQWQPADNKAVFVVARKAG